MPISLTPFQPNELCHGNIWTVVDEDQLAQYIARIALGHSRHISNILQQLSGKSPLISNKESAIALLSVPLGKEPWHRDGWIFQVMSWIAAYKENPNSVLATPHMIHAHKGLDGLQIKLDESGKVHAAIIFEDKATNNPRSMIQSNVWPEFKKFEDGMQENVIISEIISLLEKQPKIDPDDAIDNIFWKDIKHYRVSITINETHNIPEGYKTLFKGYEDVIPASLEKRKAEVFYVKDLRNWMDNLANKAILKVKELSACHV
ncbi:hypothetical protein [Photobacterium phosphoreum]|uniref:hypothetical protein n=1 Tax=Photobacterium phosphoreum TaxID=659 RepID=UPI001E28A5F1|nr:hypothetical protein [Photobacterium phosphoreum]MCD9507390.1 hypothetical protein [Photobacterium phosphoreum]